jgi:hypothetical protein
MGHAAHEAIIPCVSVHTTLSQCSCSSHVPTQRARHCTDGISLGCHGWRPPEVLCDASAFPHTRPQCTPLGRRSIGGGGRGLGYRGEALTLG